LARKYWRLENSIKTSDPQKIFKFFRYARHQQTIHGVFVALACALAAPHRSLDQRITDLAIPQDGYSRIDLTKASLDFGLWKGSQGERRLSTIRTQEIDELLVIRVKVPRWQQAEEMEISFTERGLQLSLEQRDRVVVPGYCDFSYSPEHLRTVIALPKQLNFYRSFWETTDHIVTIVFTKELTPNHGNCI
jgi:hypothetical protein